jgi:hypothetical protein
MNDQSLTKRNYKLAALLFVIAAIILMASMFLTRVFVTGG